MKTLRKHWICSLSSKPLKRITSIAKSLRKTIESKFDALIYRLLGLPENGCQNAEFQMPSPSLSHEDIDRLLFESQERNLAVEAQIKSLNAEINDLYRVIEESKRRCELVLSEKL